nr:Ig-like domain-containing protein [Rosenbergiella nectarea]
MGALLASGGRHHKTKVIDNTQPVEKATPTFNVTDNQGDKQGLVATKTTIDDNTPTFSGTGQPGATIQIKASDGNTIASTMVDSKGSWTVNLPTQTDGAHSWSVTQIDGTHITSAGSIDVTIATAKAQLVINTIAGDNQLNADEHQADVTISGLSQQLPEGTQVTVSINGKNYTTSVEQSGQWSVVMPGEDAKALAEGSWTVTVTATDSTGNHITQTQQITVDTQAPTLTLDTVAGDQVVNATEHQAALILSGASNAASGTSVTVTFGAQTYLAMVDDQGKWQVTVPAETVESLTDGDYSYTASITDQAGNTATVSSHFVVDTTAPIITIDALTGDDVVNSDEQQVAQLLTGKVAGAAAGDIVRVSIGGTDLHGVVAADGTWSVGVPAAIFASLAQGQQSATVSITDAAGNTGSATHDFTLSGAAPTLSIEAISQDNVINANEALQPLALSGKSNLADGSVVTISLNHIDYQTTVTQGVWKITVPATDVMHLDNTLYTVTVTGSDSAGNLGSAQASVLVDTHLPQVSIDAFATDNLVNHDEIAVDQPLSGRAVGAAAGDNITVTLGGKTYTTTVEKDLTWHTTLPAADMAALGDGKIAIDVSVTNARGNTGESSLGIDINAQRPGLRINTVSGDDVINALEQQQDLTVTGNSEHLHAGTIIGVTVNQVVYNAVVDDQGHWQIGIPAADMAHWPAGALSITATACDAYGNSAAINHPIRVNNDQVALTIDTVSSDDMINAAEQQQALVLSGKTQQVEAGQSVIIKFAGQLFTASVEKDGSWHVTVPASAMSGLTDGRTEISATVADVSGNSTESARIITVDTQPPAIAIDRVTADNQLNASEAQQPLVISGSSTAKAGQKVTVTLGGKTYSATVDKQGHWQVTVPSDDLVALPQGNNAVTATVSDISGNSSSFSHDFTVDTVVPVVTINPVAGDDVINAAEHQQAQIISGSATGGAAGDTVTITLNGQSYTAVLDAQGQWSAGIPSSAVAALQEGKSQISVTVTDHAGNTGTATHDVTVNTQDPALVFDPIADDNVVNANEHQATLTLSGRSSDLAEGTSVTVVIAGKAYTAITDSQGNWSVTLSAQDVSALPEGQLSISASATNDVGNSVSSSTTITVDTHLPTVSINTTAGDDVINASELAIGQTLSGKVSGAAAGDTVTVHLGGNTYTSMVAKDLTWSINVSSDDLTAMGNGPLTVDASVTNQHGNTGNAQHAISIDANLPGLRVNTVAGDDVINTIEHNQNLLITGSSQGIAENSTLTVTINGKTYSASVMADGSWCAAVPSSDVSTWTAGSLQIAVSGESSAGNPVNILHPVTVDLADVAISINTVSNDDVINAAEKGQDLALSGSTHDAAEGSQVTVTVAGHQYTTTVESDGKWAVTVPAADLATLHDGISHVEASVTTPTGNSAQAGREIQIDTQPPSLTIDNLTQDNVLNAQESNSDQLISGSTTAQAGQEVMVSLNGKDYKTTVDAQGHWQVKIPATDLQALSEGQTSIHATVADKAGNSTQAEHSFQVDAQAPVITINKVAGDDIINIDEHNQAQIISGSATGGVAGNSVTVTLGGKTYTTVLDAAGKWSVGVPVSVISGLQDGNVNIAVTVTDSVGNVGKASHDITVDTKLPSISINSVTSDNVINAAEKGQVLTLSGSTSHIEPGNTVKVSFAGKSYTVVVDAKGNWTLYVPSSALADLKEGSAQVQVSVHNNSGNSVQASHEFMVDSIAPILQLDPISTNNVVNAQEAQQPLTLTGSTSAEAGQTVNVTFNNKHYSATVEADGSWTVTIPQKDVAALQDGQYKVSASVEDKAGNSSTSAIGLLVDITAPETTITTVAGDNIVNATEHSQALIIQGKASGTEMGDVVAVTLNGKTYNVIVDAQGQWSLGIPAADVSAMSEGDYQVTVTVTDKAGNSQSTTHDIHVELTAPVLSINTIAGDDIINSTEKGQDLTITGQATGLASGAIVTVHLNGQHYTATVDDKGQWSTVIPAADVANLGEAIYSVSASATNDVGNSASTTHTITVGGEAPTITINTVAGDDVINASELAAGQILSGKVSAAAAGDTVTVTLGGKTYTATVAKDLTWSVKVPSDDLTAMGNGALTVAASVTNKAGNTGHAEHAISIDANLPGLRVDTVAGDDIVNTIEHNQNLIVSGSSQGIAANSALTLTINGKTYSATVLADGSWSAAVPSSDVSAWPAGRVQIAVSGESRAGNPVAILHPVTVDLAEVAISINTVSGDDMLNAVEKGQDLVLSGSTHEVVEGSTVTVKFAGHQYTTRVDSDGKWAVTVPAADMSGLYDGQHHVEVSVTTPTGNSAQVGREILVDTVAPSLTIDNLTQDNVLNAKEAGSDQLISGSSTAQAGQEVTVSLNGKDYKTTVDAQGHWQVTVPAADLQALSDGQTTISASVADKAGNTTDATHNVQVDLQAPVITVDKVAGDDIININEHAQAQIISGSATGGEAGNNVVVTLAGKTYTTVLDAAGKWSVGVPASVIAGLQDGTVSITVTVTDSAGNVGQQSHEVVVNTAEVGLTIDTVAQDDVINATEAGQALTVQGDSKQFATGTTVTVTLNQKQYTATIDAKGHWQLEVPAADVAALKDASNYVVSVAASDSAGNSAQASHSITINTTAPVISINTVAGDDVLNAAEQQQPLVLSGSTTAQAGQTVTVTLGSHSYTTIVKADGSWQLSVASDDLQGLAQGVNHLSVSVSDVAGNEGHTSHNLTVDTQAPTLTIDTVAGDDNINSDEQKAGQTLSGTSTAEEGQSVTVTFNGHSYTTTVDKEGKWSVKVSAQDLVGLRDGDYTVTATVSDKAGNPGQASHTVTLSGDVPTITIDTFAADDVVNAAEHSQPLIVSGTTTAPAGQHVSITLNGKTYTAVVDDKGNWQATISSKDITALADGETYVIQAQVANSIGNSGSVSHSINVDITAPSMGITIDALQDDTGLSATDFITNDAKVVLNGKLSAALADDEHAQISLDGGKTWQNLTVTGNTWTFSDGRTLVDGSWDYQVRVIDEAGNVGATAEQKVVIDTTAPDAATITIDAIVQDTGLSDHDFITSDTQLSVTGTLGAELGKYDHAQVSIDGGKTWVDVSVSGKTWTYVDSRTLTDGKYNYQVRVIDDAGNISATASQVVTVDTQVPDSSKTISIESIDQDTGLHSNDFITSDTSLTVKGSLGASLSANEYAQISLDNGKTWQNVNVIGTQWNYTDSRTLTDGNYTYWVRVVDAAGNVGDFTHQQVTIDTVAPDVAEKVTIDDITVDSGFDAHDYLTNQTSYTLEGSLGKALQANEYVQVSIDGGKTWTDASVDGTSWRYQESRTLTDGVYNYHVRVIDEAGNIGSTTSQKVTVDTKAPDYGITIDGISDDTGQSASDFITMDQTLTLRGTLGSALASDERVQISLDGGQTWVDTTVTHKQWTYSDSRTLADGDYSYQVRIIDQAGNVGSVAHQTVTVDTTAPASQGSIVSYTDDQGERQGNFGSMFSTDDTAPVINGTLSQAVGKGDTVQLFRDGVLIGLVTMTDSTHWTYQDNGLSEGKHSYFVRVMDLAGNYTDSASFALKVDTTVPTTVATINAVTTSDTTPIINGTVSAPLENGEYIQVVVGGKTYTSEEGGAVVIDYAHNTWYLQVPDSSALAANSYDVTAQIKSSAGNGNTTGLAQGTLVVNTDSVNTDWATATGAGNNSTMLIGMNSQGLWTIGANGQIYNGTDLSSYDGYKLTNTRWAEVVNMTGADVNRSGVQTLYGTETDYGYSTQITWTFDGSNYNGSQLAMGTTIHYGGVIAYDRTGDGYLDLAYGDAGMDSLTYLNNSKGVLTPDGNGGESNFNGQFDCGREISGVDLNNDGTVDIVQHTNRYGAYTMTVITNQGDGNLAVGQDIAGVFVRNGTNSYNAASMTWADFNGDGYMDLYIASGYKGNAGLIYYNDGTGKLATTGTAVESTGATQGYLSAAVDWNGDGEMDVVKFSTYGGAQTATLFTNNNHGASFTASNLASKLVNVTGIAAMDYDWNGTQDLLVSQQNGKVVLIQNNNKIADGTAMHLRIVDSEGINVFYGNTINLYNSAGKLVASQIINAQSGIGVNDTSALVSFYGLNPNEIYSAQLVKITNGKSDNVTWNNLEAGNGKESYALTADAVTGGHSGTLTGTGYNDTFVAEEGNYTYNGGGGWTTRSDHDSWSTTGGVDVVDYRNATAGVNVDLSISSAQDTGFNTSRLVNIEGINGSDFNDVITGSKGDNQFEGRGGNDTFNIGNGGHDTMLYKLINSADATGGNGSDVVNGFTVGTWESTADTDRIDLRELLSGSGYKGDGSASYVDGVATLGASAGNITDYLHVVQNGSNTEIQIDRDGTGSQFSATTIITLNGVQTDLATLLANHQLLVV